MKNKTKLFIISALSVCALSLGVTAVSASAETNAPTFTFGGTSIRLSKGEGDEINGVRFAIQMSTTDWDTYSADIAETWITLSYGETTSAPVYTTNNWYTVDENGMYVEKDFEAYQSTVVLYQIPDTFFGTKFKVQSFARFQGSEEVVASDVFESKSMNEVAILYAGTDANKLERVDAYLPAYTVTFNVDGEMYDTQKVKYGKVATAPETAPTKEGYTFDGWDYDFSAVTGDVTVNAKWEVNTYTVTFNVNDETYFETTVPYGTGASALAQVPNPEKAGYTFVGWVYENGEVVKDTDSIKGDVVLNAHFTKKISTVDELKAISGVKYATFVLQKDLTIAMSDSMVIETLASTLDLNGYTITYTGTHATLQCVSLIGELAETGVLCNGKIVAENIWWNMYSDSHSLVIARGTGLVKNMEINAAVAGVISYNTGFVTMLSANARYENVVIYASNTHSWAMSDQGMNAGIGIFEFGNADTTTISTSIQMKNVIIISNNANLGAWQSWGRQPVTMANIPVRENSEMYASVEAYTEAQNDGSAEIDTTKFDAEYWTIDATTGMPTLKLNNIQNISTVDELKAISGVVGKYFVLQDDLTITMSDSVVIEKIASTLDLNGHTITYTGTSATYGCVALIGELAETGVICNGKIVAGNPWGNWYPGSGSLVITSGKGLVKNMEIEAGINGVMEYNKGLITMLSANARYENVVIYATQYHSWAQSDDSVGGSLGIFDFGNVDTTTIETSIEMKNVVIISDHAHLGAWLSWGRLPVTMANIPVRENSEMYASVEAYTAAQNDGAAEIDTTKFDAEYWTIDATTGMPTLK